MSSSVGKKNIAHKGSKHGVVAPAAMSLVSPPAPPVPTPFPYTARSANGKKTASKLKVDRKKVLVDGSTMKLDPPANQPAQTGGGDAVTHATKNIAVMTMGSITHTVSGKGVCATGDIAALNVLVEQAKVAQMQLPLLEAGDFDTASKAAATAAPKKKKKKRPVPPAKATQCRGGHPVDLGTGYVVDDAIDLELPGFISLVWSRSYSSSSASHRGALGKGGWTHSFEQWVEVTETGFCFHDEEGLPVELGPIGEGGFSFHRGKRLELRQSGRTLEIRSLVDRLIRTFSPLPSGRHALRSIRDAHLHQIELEYEGSVLSRIIDSVGREVRLTNDAKGRVARVEIWASEPGSGHPPTLQTWFDYGYHPEGELASHTNALGHPEGWEYDGLHRMIKATLRNGVSFYYEYDAESGHCVHTWGDGGLHDVRIEIDFEKGETCTHGTNRARRYLWKNGLVYREETFGGEWATERTYDEDELLVALKNGAEETTTYEYDDRGNLIQKTDPAGNISIWEFRDDLQVRHLDPTGLETRYTHDHYGSLLQICFATGVFCQFEMDREGRPNAIYEKNGACTQLAYDAHSNMHSETSVRGLTTRYRYDALGRPVEHVDALDRKSRVRYDRLGRILESLRPDGTRVQATYDRLGHLASATDALGHTTQVEHGGTGHLARLVQSDGQVYRLFYDSDERLVRILNPLLERYEFEYDRADQIVTERTFDERTVSYRYNRAGRVIRVDHPEGEWRELSHDKLGNVLEDRGSDVQIAFTRDPLGRIEKAVCHDATGKVITELERDRFGRLTADIQNGRAVRYEYDDQGRRTARMLSDGERTEYHYGLDGALSAVAHEGTRVSIERDALGRERTRRAQGWRIEREYDEMDRLLSQKVIEPEPGAGVPRIVAQRCYGYDAKGRPTSIDSLHGGLTVYQYDRVDQVVGASCGATRKIFEYDPTGSLVNILTDLDELGRKQTWSFAPGNQLEASNRAKYVNDDRGRRIQRIERPDGKDLRIHSPRGEERITTYGWDSKDRLREVVMPDGVQVRFTYDAFGRRARKEVRPPSRDRSALFSDSESIVGRQGVERQIIHFLWDGDVLCEEHDVAKEGQARKRVHVHEPGTFVPMLQVEQGQVLGVVTDHLGMPKELVNNAGEVLWRMEHDPFGNPVVRPGAAPRSAIESPFRLLGQYADEETGLCFARFRYFEAATGRWLSPDPLGWWGGTNTQALCVDPLLGSDPYGLACNKKRLNQLLRDLTNDASGSVKLKGNGISVEMLAALSVRLNERNIQKGRPGLQEIAVTQDTYGTLRLRIGTEGKVNIPKGELYVAHTHPVYLSEVGHMASDVQYARVGGRVEVVVDQSGGVYHFQKQTHYEFQQPPQVPPESPINDHGFIVGY